MRELTYYKDRWIALGEDGSIAAVGETMEEARRFAVQTHPRSRLTLGWVSPYPPHLLLPEWPLAAVREIDPGTDMWMAGGPVRDLLIGRTPHDWDFVTTGSGLKAARAIANALGGAYYPLDSDRGTGRAVVVPPHGEEPVPLDFAELRGPNIEADLWRRDFTVNAMALTLEGKLIDPVGGQQDLEGRVIRMTTPDAFVDDPARLLRAVRLATQFSFTLEPQTKKYLRAHAPHIQTIAEERIQQELVKLLAQPNANLGLALLKELGLLSFVLPEVSDAAHDAMALLKTLHGVDALLRGEPNPPPMHKQRTPYLSAPTWAWQAMARLLASQQGPLLAYMRTHVSADLTRADLLKWCALFCPVSDGALYTETLEHVESRLQALRFSSSSIAFAKATIRCLQSFNKLVRTYSSAALSSISDRSVYRFYRCGADTGTASVLLALSQLIVDQGNDLERVEWQRHLAIAALLFKAYFNRYDAVIAPTLPLTGTDVIAMGLSQGPAVGQALEMLREAVAAGEIADKQTATAFVQQFIKAQSGLKDVDSVAYDEK